MVDSLLGFVSVVLIEDDNVELLSERREADALSVVVELEKNKNTN